MDRTVRSFVSGFLVDRERPPTVAETAAGLGREEAVARDAHRRPDRCHGIVLGADGATTRMAHPCSGVPTPFWVRAGGDAWRARCRWHALGVPAAGDGEPLRLTVTADRIRRRGR